MARRAIVPIVASLVLVAGFMLPAVADQGGTTILGGTASTNDYTSPMNLDNISASGTGLIVSGGTTGIGIFATGVGLGNSGVQGDAGSSSAYGLSGTNFLGGTAVLANNDNDGGIALHAKSVASSGTAGADISWFVID